MAHANTMFQKTEAKPEFTDYTVAGTNIGRFKAALLKEVYAIEREAIEERRAKFNKCPYPGTRNIIRRGYPKRRQRDEDIPSHRGVPHSGFLKQFKVVDRVTFSNALGEFVYSAKVYVLHATRGWKLYA